jgi:hypothetical protein
MTTRTVTTGSQKVEIPDIWLAGFCTANHCSVKAAIDWYIWQDAMEREDRWIEPPWES